MSIFRAIIPLIIFGLAAQATAADRRYSVSDFDKIRVVGASNVVIDQARATTVRASGNREALDLLSVEVLDRVLTVQPIAGNAVTEPRRNLGAVTLFITAPSLNGVKLNGSGAIKIAVIKATQADISLTGSGQITVATVAVDRLSARLSGSGTLALTGKALSVDANIKGSGNVVAASLDVADLKLMAASSGLISMSAKRSAMITSTGPGTIAVTGGPS